VDVYGGELVVGLPTSGDPRALLVGLQEPGGAAGLLGELRDWALPCPAASYLRSGA